MAMTSQEFEMLKETRDSTIRQEGVLERVDQRLDDGDKKFREYEHRLAKVEKTIGPFKLTLKVAWAVVGGVCLAIGSWIVDHWTGKKP